VGRVLLVNSARSSPGTGLATDGVLPAEDGVRLDVPMSQGNPSDLWPQSAAAIIAPTCWPLRSLRASGRSQQCRLRRTAVPEGQSRLLLQA